MRAPGVRGLFGIPNSAYQLRLTIFQLISLLLKQAETVSATSIILKWPFRDERDIAMMRFA